MPGRPWSFDPQALAGARALKQHGSPDQPFLPAPLPPRSDPVIELDNLVRFVEHPVRALLRDRLGINVSEYYDEIEDALPVELDALAKWGVGQRLLDGVLAGADLGDCRNAELARGTLPPGHLGATGARRDQRGRRAARERGRSLSAAPRNRGRSTSTSRCPTGARSRAP